MKTNDILHYLKEYSVNTEGVGHDEKCFVCRICLVQMLFFHNPLSSDLLHISHIIRQLHWAANLHVLKTRLYAGSMMWLYERPVC